MRIEPNADNIKELARPDHGFDMTVTRAFVLSLAAFLIAQGIADTLLNLGQLLKERYYQYEIVSLPVSATLLALYLYRLESTKNLQFSLFLPFGVFFGYLGSFVAFYFLPLFAAHGWQRFLQLPKSLTEWATIAYSPLVIFSWLVGGTASAIVILLVKKMGSRAVQISVGAAIIGALLLTGRFSLLGHFLRFLRGQNP